MNRRGLFCFLIVIAFVSIQGAMLEGVSQREKTNAEAKALCFELERLDFERAILEENTDFLIAKTMENEIKKGSVDTEKIRQKANEKIFLLLQKKGLDKNFSIEFLNENSKVLLIGYENFFLAEYSFTGGTLKNNFLKARLESKNAKKEFEIPIGYSLKAIVAR